MTLDPGDVITTGTPAGVGLSIEQYLAPGDLVELSIDGLGSQRQIVRAATTDPATAMPVRPPSTRDPTASSDLKGASS